MPPNCSRPPSGRRNREASGEENFADSVPLKPLLTNSTRVFPTAPRPRGGSQDPPSQTIAEVLQGARGARRAADTPKRRDSVSQFQTPARGKLNAVAAAAMLL